MSAFIHVSACTGNCVFKCACDYKYVSTCQKRIFATNIIEVYSSLFIFMLILSFTQTHTHVLLIYNVIY